MSGFRKAAVAVLIGLPLLSGCFVPVPVAVREERRPPPPYCPAFWVRGHYDRGGYWHPGHWQCER